MRPKTANIEDGVYASALAKRAIELKPDEASFQNTLGLACFRAGELIEARAALEKSLAINTDWAGADWYVLAMVCHSEGKSDDAAAYLKNAIQWRLANKPDFADLKLLEAEAQELLAAERTLN